MPHSSHLLVEWRAIAEVPHSSPPLALEENVTRAAQA